MSAFLIGDDLAGKKAGLPLDALEDFLDDVDYQPLWRPEADRAAEYYDGNQLDPKMIAEMERRGQPILIHNLIAPAIDGVLGAEAKTRTQWEVKADNDEFKEVAEGLNQELNEAARIATADRACADAYAAQTKTGLGWVEVNRNSDPFKYRYRTNYVHRREIFWDWHSKLPDLSDARWLIRQRWLDEDEAVMAFPKHKELVEYLSGGYSGSELLNAINDSPDLAGAYSSYADTKLNTEEYWDSQRRRIRVFEVYYRVYDRRHVLKTSDGTAILFNIHNPVHLALVNSDQAEVEEAVYSTMRMAYFLGPHRVSDMPSPHPHNHFPYVPFFGFREDQTDVPYGLIRRMIPSQDEINVRRSKITALLNKYRVIKEHDALYRMSDDEMLDELGRDDSVINLKKGKEFKIDQEFSQIQQQFTLLQDSVKMIQDTAGIYSSFLGQESNATSGVAIDSLVEQGSTTLGELNDNYRYSRQQVGQLLLANIVQDLSNKKNHAVKVNGDKPSKKKTVVLNQVVKREDGTEEISNQVVKTKAQVVLADITSTPGYRAQQRHRLMEVIARLPDSLATIILPFIIEDSDIPNRDEITKLLRQAIGQAPDMEDMTDEEKQQYMADQEAKQAEIDMQMAEVEARIAKVQGEARKVNAQATEAEQKAGMAPLQAEKLTADTQHVYAQMKKIIAEVITMRKELMERMESSIRVDSQKQNLLNSVVDISASV